MYYRGAKIRIITQITAYKNSTNLIQQIEHFKQHLRTQITNQKTNGSIKSIGLHIGAYSVD